MLASSSPRHVHIAIVGGGLGGLALAIGLQKNSVPFHIYEAAAQFSEIGAGVVFGANAICALDLIDPALLKAYRKHGTANPPGEWLTYRYGMDKKAESLQTNDQGPKHVGDIFWKQYDGAESGYVHRARLLDEMVKLLPASAASFKKRLSCIKDNPAGGLLLTFEDGVEVSADAVVGCDGIKSSTRAYAHGDSVRPRYTGQYAYRQLFPRDVVVSALGQERADSMTLECGYGSYIIHYPVEGGSLINMTAVCHDERPDWTNDEWLLPVSHDSMLQDWKDWDPQLLQLISQIKHPERRALFDLRHGQPYAKGTVCLLGDSAHAATPHNGAGAAMAMEDAYILSSLLTGCNSREDIAAIFWAYDCVRRPRTQRLIRISRSTGRIKSFTGHGVLDDIEKIKQTLDFAYQEIWEVDLKADLDRARELKANAIRAQISRVSDTKDESVCVLAIETLAVENQ
ncbi:hypothetical protein E8E13_001020 [Curvularia kusanoi]|uniref:FAD-binding domain-containing protein n=1 Tax=Curvularia kusanoi TaxID=90978 RepID=A0A9P4W3S2_CURKU|nr:hypothetical protein E8E13_001020 [Curvularia kusanoi]